MGVEFKDSDFEKQEVETDDPYMTQYFKSKEFGPRMLNCYPLSFMQSNFATYHS